MGKGPFGINPPIEVDRVRSLFKYDPDSGALTRCVTSRGAPSAKLATWKRVNGYLGVFVDGHELLAHRVIWFHFHGEWPMNTIDHINGDKSDNRISNLRDVPHKVNSQNVVRAKKNNAAGVLGVHFRANLKKPWRAGISHDGAYRHIGYFSTAEEAHSAYVKARQHSSQPVRKPALPTM